MTRPPSPFRLHIAIAIAIAIARGIAPAKATAQNAAMWRPDDRVLVSDFSNIVGLARSNDALYAATPNGLLVYDIVARRFRLPITVEDGYPVRERPTAVAYAHSDFTLIVGTSAGGLFTLSTTSQLFDNMTRVPGAILRLVATRTDIDAYAQTTQSWYRLRPGSVFLDEVAGPPPAPSVGANDPYLRAMLGTAGSIPGRFTAAITSLESDRLDGGYFVGTSGNGLMQLNTRAMERTRLPYGLNTRGAGAVAIWRGRVWFGGDARTPAGPVVSATPVLDSFRDHLPGSGAPQDAVTSMLATDSALWVGTTNGLYSLEGPAGSERWVGHTRAIADRVNAIAEAAGAVYVATEHGVTRIAADGVAAPILVGPNSHGIAPARDTIWIGTDLGLVAYPLTGGTGPASALRGGGSPDMPVWGVHMAGDTLYAIVREGVFRRGATGWLPLDRTQAVRLGGLSRIRSEGGTIWLVGGLGFAVRRANSTLWSYYTVSDDIPEAPVRDLQPFGQTVWLATPAGALRVQVPK